MADTKIKQLREKRDAFNARIRQAENRLKSTERKKDTRRKVLAGAVVMEVAKKDNEFSTRLMMELNMFLTRDTDRVLFGLAPVGKPQKMEKEMA